MGQYLPLIMGYLAPKKAQGIAKLGSAYHHKNVLIRAREGARIGTFLGHSLPQITGNASQ